MLFGSLSWLLKLMITFRSLMELSVHLTKYSLRPEFLIFRSRQPLTTLRKAAATSIRIVLAGIDVNVKSCLQSRVPEKRREVAKDLENNGVARHFGDFEPVMDQWISLADSAAEKAAADSAAKKDQVRDLGLS